MIPNLSIDFRSRGIRLSRLLQERSLQNLETLLGPVRDRLTSVKIRFVELPAPCGGLDQRCMIHLGLGGAPPIHAEATAGQPLQAFHLAAVRLQARLPRPDLRGQALTPLAS